MLKKLIAAAVATICLLFFSGGPTLTFAHEGGPHEVCMDALRCGNVQGWPVGIPGWVLIARCAGKESGNSCDYCDGVNNLRQCVGAGEQNNRHCLWSTGSCGAKFAGTCTDLGDILYCKKTGSQSGNCGTVPICTGDAPN